jgi:hypothetical protein
LQIIDAGKRRRCAFQEIPVLSPHEFSTLMLIKNATSQSDFDQADLLALADREFITIDLPEASVTPRLTDRGHALLARLGAAPQ